MGGRVSIQHVETKLFLDCNGSNNHGAPITHVQRTHRDQWFILTFENGTARIRTDHHNRKLCVIENGTVRLSRRTAPTPFELINIEEQGESYTQFKCSKGYLAGPSFAGPVSIVPSGRSRLALWKIIPKTESRVANSPQSPCLPSQNSQYGPFPSDNAIGRSNGRSSLGSKPQFDDLSDDSEEESEESPPTQAWSLAGTLTGIWGWLAQPYDPASPSLQRSGSGPCERPLPLTRPASGAQSPNQRQPRAAPERPTSAGEEAAESGDRIVLLRTTVLSDLTPGVPNTTPHHRGQIEEFELQEGVTQEETLFFKVTKGSVVNLRRKMTTYKMSLPVDRREEPMGTFDCSQPEHSFTFKSAPVPTGWHVRGNYACTVEFVDDSGPCCLPVEKRFAIVKRKS